MPTIPDNRALARVVPSGQAAVGQVRQQSSGVQELGEAITGAAIAYRETADARTRYQMTRAESNFLVAKEETDRSFQDDPDYETFDARYNEQMTKKLEEIAEQIRDPRARQLFIDTQRLTLERGRTQIQGLARNKEIDSERAFVTTQLDTLRDNAASGRDFDLASENAARLVEDAVAAGYYSAQEGAELTTKWRDSAALGYLRALPPDRRLAIINDPDSPVSNLPPDVIQQEREAAEEAWVATEAIRIVDGYTFDPQITSLGQMLGETSQIENPVLREEVERRLITQYGRMEQAGRDEQATVHSNYFLQLRRGEITVDDIPREEMARLTPAQVSDLYAAERQSVSERTYSDQRVLDQLYVYEARGDWRGARDFLTQNASLLSPSDYDTWSKATAQAEAPPEIKGLQTAVQSIRTSAEQAGINNDRDVSRLTGQMDRWYRQYQEQNNGKLPNANEVQDQVDFMLMEVRRPGWFNDGPVYESEDIDPLLLSALRDSFRRVEGRDPTDKELLQLVQDLGR